MIQVAGLQPVPKTTLGEARLEHAILARPLLLGRPHQLFTLESTRYLIQPPSCNIVPSGNLSDYTIPWYFSLYLQLLKLTSEKLRGGTFFAFRHAFRSFDPQGNGTVSREALYRILCSLLYPGITRQQFAAILSK